MTDFFNTLGRIEKRIRRSHLLLMLDYDGTLTPIVRHPENALLDPNVKALIKKLSASKHCTIAIVSGRDIKDIRNKIGLKNIIYAGNHGFQIREPKLCFDNQPEDSYRRLLDEIKEKLRISIAEVPGAFLEDKGFTLALHYRNAAKKDILFLAHVFHECTKKARSLHRIKVSKGKKVLEIRPPVRWNKGTLCLWLLARKRSACKSTPVLPIYIGDDITDEDAFVALKKKGITVLVGKRESNAAYFVENAGAVAKILSEMLSFIKKGRQCLN